MLSGRTRRLRYAKTLIEISMKVKLPPAKIQSTPSSRHFLWVLGAVVLLLSRAPAQSPAAGEYQVKAAFLYNFAKFVEWPPGGFSDASAPLRICVLGQDPFGQELRNITNEKTVNGRKLQIDHMVDVHLARTCHILFIASSEKTQLNRILEGVRGSYVLTVGDTKGFAELGGMINFVLEKNRVQFEVNHKAAEQAGLKISSKLLNVAKLVID
jgi:YfiR/HmsC-like